jgi:hypothetical protein
VATIGGSGAASDVPCSRTHHDAVTAGVTDARARILGGGGVNVNNVVKSYQPMTVVKVGSVKDVVLVTGKCSVACQV